MATPICAGGASLIREYFAKGYHVTGSRDDTFGFNAPATLVKAMMLNGAKPIRYQSAVCLLSHSSVVIWLLFPVMQSYLP